MAYSFFCRITNATKRIGPIFGESDYSKSPPINNIDTGDASYGWLGHEFFEKNKEYITTHCKSYTIRTAGIGGVQISECYRVPNLSIGFGKEQVVVPEIVVKTRNTSNAIVKYKGNLGLKSLMLFSKVHFNLVDFTLTASQ